MPVQPLNLLNPSTLQLPSEQLQALMPYLIVFGGTCLALVLSVLPVGKPRWVVPGLVMLTLGLGAASAICLTSTATLSLFNGMLLQDGITNYSSVVFAVCGILVCLLSFRYLERQALAYSEYYVLAALSTLGMMLMASTLNLVMIFIALELMSIPVYVLVGFRRADRRSNEAAIKYYILGSAASAVMLYGTALLYGATLSMDIGAITTRIAQTGALFNPMLLAGLLCVLIGFLFKIAAVPFHLWMPDVYDGAPTPVTAFMTTGLKAAVFITLMRVLSSIAGAPVLTGAVAQSFHNVLWVTALITMFIGNVIALQQSNVKRMLAYSSIAHSGYLMVGLIAGFHSPDGFAAVLFYITVYAVMNLGAFAVLTVLSLQGDSGLELQDLSGLAAKHPVLGFALAVFMFSMAGLPPTAGFTAKYYLFYSAVQAGEVWLVVLAVLCSAIAAYYYLRVIVFMYMREPVGQTSSAPIAVSRGAAIAVALTLLFVLELGILPAPALDYVNSLLRAKPQPTAALTTPTVIAQP